jgi:hypothetical protein
MNVFDKNKPLVFGSQNVPNHRFRLINMMSQTAPTNLGALIGGWEGLHPPQIPVGSDQAFEIRSSSSAQSQTGVSTRQVVVYGLDKDLNMIQEVALTNGSTAVPLTLRYNHINEFKPIQSGTNPGANGNLDIRRRDNTSVTYSRSNPVQQSMGWYKCPAGHRAVVSGLYFGTVTPATPYNLLVVVWRNNGSNTYEILARLESVVKGRFKMMTVLEPGDSIYAYQLTNTDCKNNYSIVLVPM